jgi:ribosomal protein L3 glutamine methyltransferase
MKLLRRSGMKNPKRSGPPPELTTIIDFIRFATTRFAEAELVFGHGTSEPCDEAIFLVCESLHLPPERVDPFLHARLTAAERQNIFQLIDARIRGRKPAAYLLHKAYIQQVPFYVDERVIVPRSYIGELLTTDRLGESASGLIADPYSIGKVLDLCTGSGCLAVLACHAFPEARVDAVDISERALEVAKINVFDHGLKDRIALHKGDLFEPVGDAKYDIILANPPYVTRSAMGRLPPEYRHEPPSALDGGIDGLQVIRRIIAEAGRHLEPNAGLLCEVGLARARLEASYPHAKFLWLDSEDSSGEVFWIEAAALQEPALAKRRTPSGR